MFMLVQQGLHRLGSLSSPLTDAGGRLARRAENLFVLLFGTWLRTKLGVRTILSVHSAYIF